MNGYGLEERPGCWELTRRGESVAVFRDKATAGRLLALLNSPAPHELAGMTSKLLGLHDSIEAAERVAETVGAVLEAVGYHDSAGHLHRAIHDLAEEKREARVRGGLVEGELEEAMAGQ